MRMEKKKSCSVQGSIFFTVQTAGRGKPRASSSCSLGPVEVSDITEASNVEKKGQTWKDWRYTPVAHAPWLNAMHQPKDESKNDA